MTSVELHIAQVEAEPDRLYWQLSSGGIKTSGVFEVSTPDDVARFTACAAHVFNQVRVSESCGILGMDTRTCEKDKGHQGPHAYWKKVEFTRCNVDGCIMPEGHAFDHKALTQYTI